MTAEKILENFIGKSVKHLRVSMISVDGSTGEGVEESSMGTIDKFLPLNNSFYIKLLENYRGEVSAGTDKKISADRIFAPLWYAPSSSRKMKHPKDFEGDNRSDKLCRELGLFSTDQMIANMDNPTMCAALASKLKFDSGESSPETLIPEEGFSAKEAEYVIERGACHHVGVNTKEYCRYIALYPCTNGKTGASFICGSKSFLQGSVGIFNELFMNIDIIKTNQKNKARIGIDLEDAQVGYVYDGSRGENLLKASSVSIARLIAGAIYTHDHLCVLRDIYCVDKLISYDKSSKNQISKVDINGVINDFARIKKYYCMATILKSIKF